ncbi:MAG: hypothetical protein Q8R76_07970 [Candidatus Omnitrophota bacterium]|nr:hypothetical protein [Candidatus Omnitrophota bacterium]
MKALIERIFKCAMLVWMFGILFLECVTYRDMWTRSLWDEVGHLYILDQVREFLMPFFSGT